MYPTLDNALSRAIPAELHTRSSVTFKVVNVKEINAFALPGGPMYVQPRR
jgi:predicted Zn-dependent protease